ncbi:MAG: hypothetical protein ABID67_02730 [Candidatus Nealsonbacteria bacterium]
MNENNLPGIKELPINWRKFATEIPREVVNDLLESSFFERGKKVYDISCPFSGKEILLIVWGDEALRLRMSDIEYP